MYHAMLDPSGFAAVLDRMTVLTAHRVSTVQVTLGRHPDLGACVIVQDQAEVDVTLLCERCVLSLLTKANVADRRN